MNVRELLHALIDHGADGRTMEDEILIRINGDVRPIMTSYSNGTFILVAGTPLSKV